MQIYYRNSPILKILGQFENLGLVIMSTRENIRLIARVHCHIAGIPHMVRFGSRSMQLCSGNQGGRLHFFVE